MLQVHADIMLSLGQLEMRRRQWDAAEELLSSVNPAAPGGLT